MHIFRQALLTLVTLLLIIYVGLIAYAYWPHGEEIPVAELAHKDDLFITIDGIQLRYQTWGAPQAGQPAIVLIHGFANSAFTFRNLGPLLGNDYYTLALDMPGFGLSDKPDDHDYSNASQANIIKGFIKALGLKQVVIGGHSMGGAHAVHVAIDAPEAVGAILLNPGIITTGVPPVTQYLFFPLPRIAAKTFADRQFRERFIKNSFVNPELITEEVMDELMLVNKTEGYMDGATQLMSYYVAGNEIEMLDDLHVPVLIVWGAQDSNKPAGEAEQLQGLIANSKLVLVDDAGHYVHVEAPEESAAAIRDAKGFWAKQR
ncbi:MAG: alpha/beta hydrolase [Gammaproteobacteria bacterium]|nr:alpha/beta hydrolase [Gammaproteobacteria bacterium]MCP4089587.1 alpha/beta hydrolase [Gammaproteobacteria bacterium]MCP4278078.1 alpha/beta hydrolase [Gammaproteobacteria bacterium]MCP4832478.1 alpha/beta hydrolase [Gammaproteobacteria bacterium]MCP4930170.1 alpha/beta hydrolase [Gammaproteobacteria bacterium]